MKQLVKKKWHHNTHCPENKKTRNSLVNYNYSVACYFPTTASLMQSCLILLDFTFKQ